MTFNVIICGAGLGGLAAAIGLRRKGHEVTILEGAVALAEVGAGIQIPPNSTRLLSHYGIFDDVEKVVVWPESIQFKRYSTGDVIGRTPLRTTMTEQYGFPYWLIHRADYHKCLLEHAQKEGARVLLDSFVVAVDDETGPRPTVILANGQKITGDIVVGADGIRSKVRESILGTENLEAIDSPNCAYRATVPNEAMRKDPATAHLMDDINANCWIGEDRHIMAYPIRNGEMYNLVMSHPGRASVGKWNEPGKLEEMTQQYHNFDPTIKRVLDKVTSCLKWKLAYMPALPRWVSKNGRVVLIGDAAHAMVPYLAQGAATSIEDGAALAECLGRATDVSMIPKALDAFQQIRKPRCEVIQSGSCTNGDIWHLPDGPDQEQRDRDMLVAMSGGTTNGTRLPNPNRWSDEDFQPWLFGYDTIAETNTMLDKIMGPA